MLSVRTDLDADSSGESVDMVRIARDGSVWVNAHDLGDSAIPFGGFKNSGFGKDMGPEQLEHFLKTKACWIAI